MNIIDEGEQLIDENFSWVTDIQEKYFLTILNILTNEHFDQSKFALYPTEQKELCINLSSKSPRQTFELLIDQDADIFMLYLSDTGEYTKTIYSDLFTDETIAWYLFKYYIKIIAEL